MSLPLYPWITFLSAVALVPWFVFFSDASWLAKIIIALMFMITLLIRFEFYPLWIVSLLIEATITIYVLIYIRLQR